MMYRRKGLSSGFTDVAELASDRHASINLTCSIPMVLGLCATVASPVPSSTSGPFDNIKSTSSWMILSVPSRVAICGIPQQAHLLLHDQRDHHLLPKTGTDAPRPACSLQPAACGSEWSEYSECSECRCTLG